MSEMSEAAKSVATLPAQPVQNVSPTRNVSGALSSALSETDSVMKSEATSVPTIVKGPLPGPGPRVVVHADGNSNERRLTSEEVLALNDTLDLTQFLLLLCHFHERKDELSKHETRQFLKPIWASAEVPRRKPLDLLKEVIVALYDEQIFPEDEFSRRAKMAISRKEVPKENEW